MNRKISSLFRTKLAIHIDKMALHNEYKQLMTVYHPDKWSSCDEKENITREINTFYTIMKHDVSRCTYLLQEKGYTFDTKLVHFTLDNPLLEELLFIGESLNEITDKKELETLLYQIREQKAHYMEQLDKKWNQSLYHECMPLLHNVSYLDKIESRVWNKLI